MEFVDAATNDLPHHLKVAVVIIEHFARGKCWAFPSTATLAKKYGCKPRMMEIVLRSLSERGWIKRVPIFPGHRKGMITLLLKRIDREDLPVFDPACPDECSEDDVRQAVWRRKGVETEPPCSKPGESAASESQTNEPHSPAPQFPDQTRRNGLRPNKAQWIAPRRKTNSSEEPLKTTTTDNPPESSSSFSNSSPQTPPIDQAELDVLVGRIVELAGWDRDKARLEIDGWIGQGSSLPRIRNTLAELERKGPKVADPPAWLCGMMKPGKTGPNGPLPPPAKAAPPAAPEQNVNLPAPLMARKLVAELRALGRDLVPNETGDGLVYVKLRTDADDVPTGLARLLAMYKSAVEDLLLPQGGSTHASTTP